MRRLIGRDQTASFHKRYTRPTNIYINTFIIHWVHPIRFDLTVDSETIALPSSSLVSSVSFSRKLLKSPGS
jgi:hypothetical protein